VVINIPPLKERHDDIISLTNYFLGKIKEEFDLEVFPKINDDVYNILLIYSWPGNIRELQNVLKRAIILGDGNLKTEIIEAIINDNFTFFNSKKENEDDTTFTWLATNDNYDIREVEKTVGIHLIKTIIKNNPSISHANIAKKIGICTRTLRSRFEEHLN
jgi:transcriptional regulator with PAS, ATPase and Fis domain